MYVSVEILESIFSVILVYFFLFFLNFVSLLYYLHSTSTICLQLHIWWTTKVFFFSSPVSIQVKYTDTCHVIWYTNYTLSYFHDETIFTHKKEKRNLQYTTNTNPCTHQIPPGQSHLFETTICDAIKQNESEVEKCAF